MKDTKVDSSTQDPTQKFKQGSFVILKGGKQWFSLDSSRTLKGSGVIKDYAPDTGYEVEIQGDNLWYTEDALELTEKHPDFYLEGFTKGQKALTRSGCIARFLQYENKNLTYKIKAEVQCSDKKYVCDYSKEGFINVGVENDLDLIAMTNEIAPLQEINEDKKPTPVSEVKPVVNLDKVKELEENAKRYEWITNYLTSSVQIDFVDMQLKQATTKEELDAIIDKLKVSVRFK